MHLFMSVVNAKASDPVITDACMEAVEQERFEMDYFPFSTRPFREEKKASSLAPRALPGMSGATLAMAPTSGTGTSR